MQGFVKGHKIKLRDADNYVIIKDKLGEGGQGIVYKADFEGKEFALKWYFYNKIKNPEKFINNLYDNILKGSPTKHFLWPLHLTEMQFGSFGYLMNLRPTKYKNLSEILNARARISSTQAVINAALNIVTGFRDLHRKGYSYQDLNDGNFFIDPSNGEVLICDNDNVAPYGQNLGIAGKCRYMAPEVVLGKKLPDVHTDRFSLAVVLFMLLFFSHPLEGAKTLASICLTEESEIKHYGSEPIFIYDPQNDTNRPVRGVHKNALKIWPVYPEFIQNAFIKSFTEGIFSDQDRISENDWRKLFIKLRDEIIVCNCGCENFACSSKPSENYIRCMGCGNEMIKPLRLQVQKFDVALFPWKKLYECHTVKDCDNYQDIAGEVIQNKNNPNLWGIKNLTENIWIMKTPDGNKKAIGRDSVIPVLRGIEIDFGDNHAKII